MMGPAATDLNELVMRLQNGECLDKTEGPQYADAKTTIDRAPGNLQSRRKHTKGRFEVANAFADESAKSVSTTAQALWFQLWRETKPNGIASISHQQIADRINVSRRTAIRGVAELVKAGLVKVVSRGSAKGNTPSTYRVFGNPQVK